MSDVRAVNEVLTAVPTIVRALADNWALLRVAHQDLQHCLFRHGTAKPEDIADAWQAVTFATDAILDLKKDTDRLLAALTAHELEWAHMMDDCPICKGEVRFVNNQEGRPF